MTWSGKENSAAPLRAGRPWFVLRSFDGWRPGDLSADVVAGLTLAAIAIPSQMATARLANFTPQIGLLALIAAAIGFALFGDSRRLFGRRRFDHRADFRRRAGGARGGGAGALRPAPRRRSASGRVDSRLRRRASGSASSPIFLSIPVTTGFFLGIAGHILILAGAVGARRRTGPRSACSSRPCPSSHALQAANPWTLVDRLRRASRSCSWAKRLSPRFPGALIGLCLAGLATVTLGLEAQRRGDARIDRRRAPSFFAANDFLGRVSRRRAARRAHRSSGDGADSGDDALFPEQRGRSGHQSGFHRRRGGQRLLLVSSAPSLSTQARLRRRSSRRRAAGRSSRACSRPRSAVCVFLFASGGARPLPSAALAGVLLFVAIRLVRVGVMVDVWRRSRAEFLLILVTALAILALPIEAGRGRRRAAVGAAWRLDDDARAGDRT